jgi:DNA repair protein RecO (recombination protein O)
LPYEKAEAITIRLTDFSETSQVAWFYTREFGRMSCLAKGAKRARNNFEGRLDLLCHTRIVFARKKRSTLHILSECKLVDRFMGLRADVTRLYAALYAAELVREMTPEEEGQPPIFDLLLDTLRALADGEQVNKVLLLFEVRLLALAGYAPNLKACAACGSEELPERSVPFSTMLGGVVCPACKAQDPKAAGVPRGAVSVLERLTNGAVTRTSTLQLPEGMLAVLRKLMKGLFCYHLGREPKLMRYV